QSLGEFIAFNCVLEDRTIFKEIYSLPSASAWVFRNGSLTSKTTYFCARDWEHQEPLQPDAFYSDICEVLSRKLPRYFAGPGRKGVALTGGFDTRVIMALAKPVRESFWTYTFGGMLRDSQDIKLARRVARECQTPYRVIRVGSEFLSRFPQYAERSMYLSEGGIDVYHAADLYLSEKARDIASIKIVGTYGSELIRQHAMF